MADPQLDRLLKDKGITFHYNLQNKIWWLRQVRSDGKARRTTPVGAKTREEAEQAAIEFIKNKL
jgi:hypothetical protein